MLATSLELLLGLEPLLGLLHHPRIPEETASHQELLGENIHSGMNVLLLGGPRHRWWGKGTEKAGEGTKATSTHRA